MVHERVSLAQKMDHKPRCIKEQFTQSVEAQHDDQETAVKHYNPQSLGCVGSACRQQDGKPLFQLSYTG